MVDTIPALDGERSSTGYLRKATSAVVYVSSAILLVGLTVTALVTTRAASDTAAEAQARFQELTDGLTIETVRRVERSRYGLAGARGVYAASKSVERSEFANYVASQDLSVELPGIMGMGFVAPVHRPDLQSFVTNERADDAPGFEFKTCAAPGLPLAEHDDLWIIKHCFPKERNAASWGLDLGSEAVRREAILRAVTTGLPAITDKIELIQLGGSRAGFLYFMPVYLSGAPHNTPAERLAGIQGLVYSSILLEETLAGVTETAGGMLDLEVFEGSDVGAGSQLFGHEDNLSTSEGLSTPAHRAWLMEASTPVVIGGRIWTFRTGTRPSFEATVAAHIPWLFGVTGVLASMLAAAASFVLMSGRARDLGLARDMTTELAHAKQSAERLADIVRHTTNIVVLTDAERRITWVNESFTRLTGYTAAEALGKSPGALLQCAATDPATLAAMRAAMNAGEAFHGKILNQSKHGKVYWLAINIQPQLAHDGSLKGFMAIETEITEHIQVIEHHQTVFAATADGILVSDATGRIVAANPAAEKIFGLTKDELCVRAPDHPCWQATCTDGCDLPRDEHPAMVTLRTGQAFRSFVYSVTHVSGESRWISVSTAALRDVTGVITGVVASMTDITEQFYARSEVVRAGEEARAALNEIETLHTALAENSLVSVADRSGKIVHANTEFCQISGYALEELLGQDHRILNSGHHEKQFWINVWQQVSTGRTWRGEVCNRRKDGELYWVDSTITPSRGADGRIEKYVSIRFDITAQKAAQSELQVVLDELEEKSQAALELAARAEAATRAKSEFLANMSHEIRTPMTAILGFADILGETVAAGGDPDDAIEQVRTIRRNGEHLLALINDILDISKIEAGRLTVESIEVSPTQILREVESLMQPRAIEKGIRIDVVPETMLPEWIQTDPVRLRQILVNLVGNAIKFTEQGGVTVSVRCEPQNRAGSMLRFVIEDTGVGISPERLPKVFQAFEQADASTTRKFGGTGLGLSISQTLAHKLGGRIVAASELGKSTVFVLTIATGPLDDVAMIDAAQKSESLEPAGKEFLPRQRPLLGVRIFFAEDGPDNRRLVSYHLQKAGAEVTMFENGKLCLQALTVDGTVAGELITPSLCDLVLSDMQMPEMDGYTLARSLRAKSWQAPIIALTAHAMSGDAQKCYDAGCDGYATKPIVRDDLIAACIVDVHDNAVAPE
ncbi:MAG: PAS domain S-box-containing protein [Planctomycetota bacterium]|jgi:PAS domain S-box-containing protein